VKTTERVVVIHYPYKIAGTNYECVVRATVVEHTDGGINGDALRYDFNDIVVTYPEDYPDTAKVIDYDVEDNLSVLNYLLQEYETLVRIDEDLAGYSSIDDTPFLESDYPY